MGKIRVYIAGDWLSDFYTSEYVAIVTDYGHFDFFNRNKDGDILKSQENDKNINPQDENKLPYSIRILHKAVKGQTYNRAKLLGLIDTLNYLNTSKRTIIYTNSTYLTDPFNKDWITKWKIRGWSKQDGTPLMNKDLWEKLYKMNLTRHLEFQYINKEECEELVKAEKLLAIYAKNDVKHNESID